MLVKRGFLLIALALLPMTLIGAKKTFPKVGDAVRNFYLMEFSSARQKKYVSLKKNLMTKDTVVIFSFFNSTCINCKKEIPRLQAIAKQYKNVKLVLIASEVLNSEKGERWSNEGSKRLAKTIKDWGITATVLDDHYHVTAKNYGLSVGGNLMLPATFMVKNGKYIYAHRGFKGDATVTTWKAILDKNATKK